MKAFVLLDTENLLSQICCTTGTVDREVRRHSSDPKLATWRCLNSYGTKTDIQLRLEIGAVPKVPKKTLSDAGLDADVSRKIRKLKINPQGKVPFNQSSILNLPTSAQFRDVLTQTLSSQKLLLGYQTDGSMLDILQTSILPISLLSINASLALVASWILQKSSQLSGP